MRGSPSWTERIFRAADFVHVHLDEDLAVEDLAVIAGFSLHHFHRVFRGLTGESVMAFVRRLRLERAAGLLGHGRAPVTEIALASGYGSHEAFTRAFRARFGVAPRQYRERDQRRHDLPWTIRDEPERVAFALRHVGPYDECGRVWERLRAWAGPAGVVAAATSSIGLCYDDPDITDASKLRYDAGLVIPGEMAPRFVAPVGVVVRRVSAGRYAVASHRGPYDTLEDTYLALLGAALPLRGVELADEPVVEVYVDDPAGTPPADLCTEVCVRIS